MALGRQTVADQLVEVLVAAGAQRIYGLVGEGLNPVSDAVRRSGGTREGGIDWVHVHNEESAALAAAAEAQLTGRLAVCAGSCGPGNTHLIQGVFNAHQSGAPVVVIASHIPTSEIGTGFFQETHPEQLFAQASHWCEVVSAPAQVSRLARIAIQHAVGRRGAAVLVLPGDTGDVPLSAATELSYGPVAPAPVQPSGEAVQLLADRLDAAETVAIFGGIGCAGAREEVLALAGALNAPVGHSLRGKEVLQYDNAFDVGMSGLLGYGAAHDACHGADLLLLLGTDFPYREFLPQARTIQVDHDPSRLGRRTPLELGVAGDVGATIRAVLPKLRPRTDRSFLDEMLRRHVLALEHVVEVYTTGIEALTPIHPEFVARVLDEEAADDAIFTVDTGMCATWAARYVTPNGRRRIIGSWVHGTVANALAHAVGAHMANPERPVVAMCGDGGVAMLLGELLTVAEHDAPIKIVVFDNARLDMVRMEMMVAGDPPFAIDHRPVDYAAIAAAAGLFSVRIEHPADVRDGIRRVLDHDGPALLDVRTDANASEMPPHVTAGQARGLAEGVTRAVLAGGVGGMVQLARANLRNNARPQVGPDDE